MAHFYGTLRGHRGRATRQGTVGSGIDAVAASYQGAVNAYAYRRGAGDEARDYVRISFTPWQGAGLSAQVYDGPIAPDPAELAAALRAAADQLSPAAAPDPDGHVCEQCGADMGPMGGVLGPVCGDCCRKNHRAVVNGHA